MVDGIVRMQESDSLAVITVTPTVPITCPPCTMVVKLESYLGLKVISCSVTFSAFEAVMASKTIMIQPLPTPSSFSRVVWIVFSTVIPAFPGSPWDNYTPLHCPVRFSLRVFAHSCIIKSKDM